MAKIPLTVKLAGFNIDIDALDKKLMLLEGNDHVSANEIILTPETISAAYARISRDSRHVSELREDSIKDIERARTSNKSIIFKMGHKSVAEHSVFNFDISGISRRAVEEVESKRLQSYTERSQRYVTFDNDFVIPREIEKTPLESRFIELTDIQNRFYKDNLGKIVDWHNNQDYSRLYHALNCDGSKEKQEKVREDLGKEDARYSLSMATQTQLGMTSSARNIEVMISKLRSSEVEEFRELGEKLFIEVDGIAPSIIKYTKPADYFSKTRLEMAEFVRDLIKKHSLDALNEDSLEVRDDVFPVSLYSKLDRDSSIIAGLIFSSSNIGYRNCLRLYQELNNDERIMLVNQSKKYKERQDPELREFELGDRVAEFILSSSAFAQMKRHRMNTVITQPYLNKLGCTIPLSIREIGLIEDLLNIVNKSGKLYEKMIDEGINRSIAEYALTNAHRRRMILDANNRQVYAICLERENLAAQWDIRNLIGEYHRAIQIDSPLTTHGLCGKHEFHETKKR